MKIDVHSHHIDEIFFDALRSLPGVTVKVNPDRFISGHRLIVDTDTCRIRIDRALTAVSAAAGQQDVDVARVVTGIIVADAAECDIA